jgi:hypothetical protein
MPPSIDARQGKAKGEIAFPWLHSQGESKGLAFMCPKKILFFLAREGLKIWDQFNVAIRFIIQ